jgi:hypothetical protein
LAPARPFSGRRSAGGGAGALLLVLDESFELLERAADVS